jgi:hypothetical protein
MTTTFSWRRNSVEKQRKFVWSLDMIDEIKDLNWLGFFYLWARTNQAAQFLRWQFHPQSLLVMNLTSNPIPSPLPLLGQGLKWGANRKHALKPLPPSLR